MNDFDKTIKWLQFVGVGYKIIDEEQETILENRDCKLSGVTFDKLNCDGLVSIKIGGNSSYGYRKHSGYNGFFTKIKFDESGNLLEFGNWE